MFWNSDYSSITVEGNFLRWCEGKINYLYFIIS